MKTISREYAEALFALACELGNADKYAEQLNSVWKIIGSESEFFDLISMPSVPVEERLAVIDKVFADSLDEYVLSFLKLLIEKSRIGCFCECVKEYNDLVSAMKNQVYATVRSSVPLTEEQKASLTKKLSLTSGKNVILDYRTEEGLIGGIVVEMDGKIMDGSLRHKLNEIKGVIGK